MADIPSRDWNPFLWAGSKLNTKPKPKKKDGTQEETEGLRTKQSSDNASTASKAGGIFQAHFQGTLNAPSQKGAGHVASLGPILPPKPRSLEGVPSVRKGPKGFEANPEYRELKKRIQHFEEASAAVRGNPNRAEFSEGM
jgi:hypothetical protein